MRKGAESGQGEGGGGRPLKDGRGRSFNQVLLLRLVVGRAGVPRRRREGDPGHVLMAVDLHRLQHRDKILGEISTLSSVYYIVVC